MLSERLETIKNIITNSNIVLDVGTDHGYVPISLIMEKKANKVIASDINKGPLENAKKNVSFYGLEDKIELRLGGGIKPLNKGEADTVIIAGMGGMLIRDIIDESMSKVREVSKLILQPMNSFKELREYLINNNFDIVKEHLARENEKIYNIFEVVPVKGKKEYLKESFFILGHPDNFIRNDDYEYYILKRKEQANKVLANLKNAKQNQDMEINCINELLADLEEYYA